MNAEDFKQRVRQKMGSRPHPPRVPRVRHPTNVELRYYAELRRRILAAFNREVRKALSPEVLRSLSLHEDAGDRGRLEQILRALQRQFGAAWVATHGKRLAEAIAGDTDRFHVGQLGAVLERIAGVNPLGGERWLKRAVERFTKENVDLIADLPKQALARIRKELTGQVVQGARWEAMAQTITETLGMTERRARLIARDQVGKLYGDLQKTRTTELGLEAYIWRTMNDNRVRDEHELLAGQRFTWSKPPPEGHPGEAVLCRCYAEPDLEQFMRSL